MSKEFDQIIKQINQQNKDLHNIDNHLLKTIVQEVNDIKKSTKVIETKIVLMEKVLNQLFDVINNITIFIDDAEDIIDTMNDDEEEDWTPYDERNFSYNHNNDEDEDDEDIGGDDYWSSHEDES